MKIPFTREIAFGRARYHNAELTPNGREVLVGGFEGVATYEVATSKETRRYRKYEGTVIWAARMSRDGKRVVAGNGHLRLDVWDAKSKKRLFELETEGIVSRLSLSVDGKRAVTASMNNTLAFWDIVKGKHLGGTQTKKSFVIAAASSPDGMRALYGGTDGVVRLFDLAKNADVATSPGKGWIEAIVCSDEGTFASGGRDKTVMLWDEAAKPIRTLRGFSRTITCVAISPDGTRVAATGGGSPMVWNAKTGESLGSLDVDKSYDVRFSHDGASIVALGTACARVYDTP